MTNQQILVPKSPIVVMPERRILRVEDVPSIWDIPGEFEWLIDDAITVGSVNLLSAESGTGKSWVAYPAREILPGTRLTVILTDGT